MSFTDPLVVRLRETLSPFVSPQSRLLIAVSGGPDSVALAHAMRQLPYPLVLGHVNHQLRPGSFKDAQFVRTLANRWDIPYREARIPVRETLKRTGGSLEEVARELRYAALGKMARRNQCGAIVTAHTLNDQAETVLMNFFRGSGPSGLAGIPARRRLEAGRSSSWLLRPFLKTTRSEILGYLKSHFVKARTDPSNQSLRFTRNFIRHRTLPALEQKFPGLTRRLGNLAQIMSDEELFWSDYLTRGNLPRQVETRKRVHLQVRDLLLEGKAVARRLLRLQLPGATFDDLERLLDVLNVGKSTGPIQLSNGQTVACAGDYLRIS